MGRFTVIPENTFNALQLDAGVLLKRFNPALPTIEDEDIICATTGGIKPTCKANYSDMGEDVDNCPNGMKELKKLDSWDCSIATTSLGTSPELIKMALGAADIDGTDTSKIIPRRNLKQTDFGDIWWVGDRADGGFVAIQLKNALSTEGFSLTTTKNGKGQIAITLMGHVSINAQNEVPMVFYSADPSEGVTYRVIQTLSHVTSSYTDTSIDSGDALEVTLTAATDYTLANVTVLMGGEDVTEDSYSAGAVTIATVSGDIQIIATATET